ncbi:MAG: glycosyltransferase family protein [Ginsengibacter sp.]
MINDEKIDIDPAKPRILIAPLDWGLGHATRCIPIINELIEQNCEVVIAADRAPLFLLKKEFPGIVFLRVKGYEIKYSRNRKWLPFKLLLQFPKIIFSIRKENAWLEKVINEYLVDAVISDNRFGFYSKKIPCVYITHQLYIKTGNVFSEKIAQKIHNYFIKKYIKCWVPDFKENSLAGELSHPANVPSNVVYIGPLSRFDKINDVAKIYNLLISLSGPEPQRTIFEKMILAQLKTYKKKVLLIRGLPGENKKLQADPEFIEIVNHLSAEELNKAFQQSGIIICRSGYSTIMDLVKLGKNAVLVPTPGQREQEYLSDYLMEKRYFYSVRQNNFSLETTIDHASSFPFIDHASSGSNYKKVVGEFVRSLRTGNFTLR